MTPAQARREAMEARIQEIIDRSSHCLVQDGTGKLHSAVKAKISDLRALAQAEESHQSAAALGLERDGCTAGAAAAVQRCKHCDAVIAYVSGRLWNDESLVFPQYCRSTRPSDQLHEPAVPQAEESATSAAPQANTGDRGESQTYNVSVGTEKVQANPATQEPAAAAPASAVEEVRAFGDRPLDDVADALIGWSEIANRHAAELDRLRAEREAGVWVPREPTEAMLAELWHVHEAGSSFNESAARCYRAMLTAARKP